MNRKSLERWAMTAPLGELDGLVNALALIFATRAVGSQEPVPVAKKKPGRKRGRKPGLPTMPHQPDDSGLD